MCLFNKLALPRIITSLQNLHYLQYGQLIPFLSHNCKHSLQLSSIDNFFQILELEFTANLESLNWTVPKNNKRTKENGKM
jgi:hypothetical protein